MNETSMRLWLCFAFVGACGGVGALLNKIVGRQRFNGWLFAFIALIGWSIYASIGLGPNAPGSEGRSAFEQGWEHGGKVPTLFPILLAGWAARRFQRNKREEKSKGQDDHRAG